MMGYSRSVFRVAAEIVETIITDECSSALRTFDDIVIALSLDSGLPLQEVRGLLIEQMPEHSKPAFLSANVIDFKPVRQNLH